MPAKTALLRNVSTPYEEKYQTYDGSVTVTNFKRGLWSVHPRGYAPFMTGSKREAFEQAIGIAKRAPVSKRHHSTVVSSKTSIPGIAGWNTYAGGTAAAAGKHAYDLYVPEGQYTIGPISSQRGRHLGYSLKFAATGQQPRGGHGGLWHDLGMHRSPASAAVAARKHYTASF